MLCLACNCTAVKTWTGFLSFWLDGLSVCQAWSCCFQDGYFLPFLTLGMRKPNSLWWSLISLPASTGSWMMCSLSVGSEIPVQWHLGCYVSLVLRFSKVAVVKDVLAGCRSCCHERRLLKGDREKGDVWYVWDVYPDVSDLALAMVKCFAYLTEIVHSCLLLPEWGIFSSCRWNWRSQDVKELCKDLWVSTPAWCSWKPWLLCWDLAGLG